jgi:hypothetical protein
MRTLLGLCCSRVLSSFRLLVFNTLSSKVALAFAGRDFILHFGLAYYNISGNDAHGL